jgi:hypothetical protein
MQNKGDIERREDKHYKVPIINWAYTPLYAHFLKHRR